MSENLKGKFCPKPFEYLEISNSKSNEVPCFCCCPTWVPTSVGDISKSSVEDVWNSKQMQEIRRSILDETFSYCNENLCPEILDNKLLEKDYIFNPRYQKIVSENLVELEGPKTLNLSNDKSCNLECPSCRTEKIMWTAGEDFEQMEKVHRRILDEALQNLELIIFCSSGDPFASRLYRKLLLELDGRQHPNLKIQIVTNGLLFSPEMWEKMKKIQSNIDRVFVSVDAATLHTYRIVRKGGELSDLIPNLEFLGELRAEGEIDHFQLDFVVQHQNYREMPEFVNLGKRVGADKVFFQKVVNWGTWNDDDFEKQAVWKSNHPEHAIFQDVMRHPLLKENIVKRGNLSDLIEPLPENKVMSFLKKVPGLRHFYIRTKQFFYNLVN